MRLLLLSLILSLLPAGCAQPPEKKPARSAKQKDAQEQYTPQYPSSEDSKKYKPPDGGFGTLDDSRETRRETEEQQKESQKALEQTE